MFKHILIPTDGSALSQKAAKGAIEFAKILGARVTAYACIEVYAYSPLAEFAVEAPIEFSERVVAQAQANLKEIEVMAQEAGVAYRGVTSEDATPYLGIIETAKKEGCDVIFMSSHGRRGLASLLLGSETHKVLTHTDIPVLVYR